MMNLKGEQTKSKHMEHGYGAWTWSMSRDKVVHHMISKHT